MFKPIYQTITMYVLLRRPVHAAIALILATGTVTMIPEKSSAKANPVSTERIQIGADQQIVFEALRSYRNSELHHRKCLSFDGHNALVEENLDDVPILGKVHCVWLEKEVSPQRIDYTMTQSDKFVAGAGSYIIFPSKENGVVTLELQSFVESGLHIPFIHEMGASAAHKDMRARLHLVKKIAETNMAKSKTLASLK